MILRLPSSRTTVREPARNLCSPLCFLRLAAASSAYSFPMTIPRTPSSSPLDGARRVAVKVGSALLTNAETGRINRAWLESLIEYLLRLRRRGQQVILVSSGAIALGRRQLGL